MKKYGFTENADMTEKSLSVRNCVRNITKDPNQDTYFYIYFDSGSIKIDSSTDFENWTNEYTDAEGIDYVLATLDYRRGGIAIKNIGNYVYATYVAEDTGSANEVHLRVTIGWYNTDHWEFSDTEGGGVDGTYLEAVTGEDCYNNDDLLVYDIFDDGSNKYIYAQSVHATATVSFFNISTFNIADSISGYSTLHVGTNGCLKGIGYYFAINDGANASSLMKFSGGSITTYSSLTLSNQWITHPWNSDCGFAGNVFYISTMYTYIWDAGVWTSSGGKLCILSNGKWVQFIPISNAFFSLIRDMDGSTQFIFYQDYNLNFVKCYYSKMGYMLKIDSFDDDHDARIDVYNGFYDIITSPNHIFEWTIDSIVPLNFVPISSDHLRSETMILDYNGLDWEVGLGIVATDDSDNPVFIGTPYNKSAIQDIGHAMQRIIFTSPAVYSLKRTISVNATATDCDALIIAAIASDPFFKVGTIDNTGLSFDYKVSKLPLSQFFKDMEQRGLKRIEWDEDGNLNFEDGDVSTGIVITHANMLKPANIGIQGSEVTGITVVGGVKADGTGISIGTASKLTNTDQQLNHVKYVYTYLLTDTLCEAQATSLLNGIGTDLNRIVCTFHSKGKPRSGRTISVAYAPKDLAATTFIIDSFTWDLITDKTSSLTGFTALKFTSNYRRRLAESNQERIDQVANVSKEYIDKLMLLGSANAEWVDLIFEIDAGSLVWSGAQVSGNGTTTSGHWKLVGVPLTLPTGETLRIAQWRVAVELGTGTNYISRMIIYKHEMDATPAVTTHSDTGAIFTIGNGGAELHTENIADIDTNGNSYSFRMFFVTNTAYRPRIVGFQVQLYYV